MDWTDRVPGPIQTTVMLVTLVAFVVAVVIAAIVVVGALAYYVWPSVMGG
jgi:hypothetical protein